MERISAPLRVRLPITPEICKLQDNWQSSSADPDTRMVWSASVLCFFGFFRSGEITIPSLKSFDARRHLSWGDDVAIDEPQNPKLLKVTLKYSKTDQLGK